MPKIGQRSEGGYARQLRDLRAAQIEIAADPEPLGQLRDVRTIQIKLTADAAAPRQAGSAVIFVPRR